MTIELKIIAGDALELQSIMVELLNQQAVERPKMIQQIVESMDPTSDDASKPVESMDPTSDDASKPLKFEDYAVLPDDLSDVVEPIQELDTDGLPWDKRIHSTSKQKVANGSWRIVRKPKNFEDKEDWENFIHEVKDELQRNQALNRMGNNIPDAQIQQPTTIKKEVPPLNELGRTEPTEPQTFKGIYLLGKSIMGVPEFMQLCDNNFNIQNFKDGCLEENLPLLPLIYADIMKIKDSQNEDD